MPGPIPARSEELSRERDANRADRPEVKHGELWKSTPPRPDPEWDPMAKRLLNGLKSSGQSIYFQNSDWALAYFLCDQVSYYQKTSKRSAMMLAPIMKGLNDLLFTEGERRRSRIELKAPETKSKPASVTAIDDARARLGMTD